VSTIAVATAFVFLYRNLLGPWSTYFLLYSWKPAAFAAAKNLEAAPAPAQLSLEKKMTAVHAGCDLVVIALLFGLHELGLTRIYTDFSERGLGYALLSFGLLFVIQDAWFYFTHRAFHHPALYGKVHALHHRAKNTNPWSSWCVHPVENAVEAGLWPLVVLLLPLHPLVLAAYLFTAAFLIFNGHSGYEFNPDGYRSFKPLHWLGTSTSHNLHHQSALYNFGFYFRFWDRVLGTEHPGYEAALDAVKAKRFSWKAVVRG
jgi:lathosterol oxidase